MICCIKTKSLNLNETDLPALSNIKNGRADTGKIKLVTKKI